MFNIMYIMYTKEFQKSGPDSGFLRDIAEKYQKGRGMCVPGIGQNGIFKISPIFKITTQITYAFKLKFL
jgi:hypothetical protein